MGGIVAAIPAALFICIAAYNEGFSKKGSFTSTVFCAASFAIGVGFAAAAIPIFPSAVLGMGSAAFAGAAIGVIAPISALFAAAAIVLAAEKVNEYIISPIVEKCFSLKEEECSLPAK